MATDVVTFRLGLALSAPQRLAAPPRLTFRLGLDRLRAATLALAVRYSVALTLE